MPLSYAKNIFFLCILTAVVSGLTGCGEKKHEYPAAKNGILDLRECSYSAQDIIPLDGEWEFYWQTFLNPADHDQIRRPDFFITVPRSWHNFKINGKRLNPFGYASYRLTIKMPDNDSMPDKLQLRIADIYSAYTLWINNDIVLQKGKISADSSLFKSDITPETISFTSTDKTVVITINTANYFFAGAGGIENHILLGSPTKIANRTQQHMFYYMISLGVFLIMAIYHFLLWLLKKDNRYYLIFSVICLLMAVQTLCISEKSVLNIFFGFDASIHYRIWFLVFGLYPLSAMFYGEIFPEETNKKIIHGIIAVYSICLALNLLLPVQTFTKTIIYFYIIGIFVIGYIFLINIKAVIHKRELSALFLAGLAIPALSGINDTLFAMSLIDTAFITPFGFFIFMVLQSYLIAVKVVRSFRQVETLTLQLSKLNKDLEQTVKTRTISLKNALLKLRLKNKEISLQRNKIEDAYSSLEKSNHKLRSLAKNDPLTGIANRRSFFEFFDYEWKKALRQKAPLAILFIDVDYFKKYNDSYGHIAGDKALCRIARTLSGIAKRSADITARYGGEEFIILLTDTDKKGSLQISESIRQKISDLKIPHDKSKAGKYLSVSIGVSCVIPEAGMHSNSVIRNADTALYKAKKNGRNRVED